jgi:predicted TIM-barrel fold metal-dependent hydrolase
MASSSRRQWLKRVGAVGLGASAGPLPSALGVEQAAPPGAGASDARLALADFEPRSMLHVPETRVPRARFPAIDVHTHLSETAREEQGVSLGEEVKLHISAREAIEAMDRKNIRSMVNLTGGHGAGLREAVQAFDRAYPGRFYTCTEPTYERLGEPRYAQVQADAIARAAADGARGLKILKTLGLYLREGITEGPLVNVDSPRFDPMWEACAAAKLPVFIHVADPEAFFLPVDPFNERYDELGRHPDWSFHGRDFPSFRAIMEARDRVYARHPRTQFVSLHVGHDSENLAFVAESLERFPNMTVELAARIAELGRQPRATRRFFEKYQDRILFGTDAEPRPPAGGGSGRVLNEAMYEIYYRFLETEDEYFEYSTTPVPTQGRWRIYGLGLPDSVLKKVYADNAVRVLGLPA